MEEPLVAAAPTQLLRAASPAGQATARLTSSVRLLRTASALQFFLPHGIVGLFWSAIWLTRQGSDGDYFERMGVLRGWIRRANGLMYNVRLAAVLSSLTTIAGLLYLPFFLGATLGREHPEVSSAFEVTIPLLYIVLSSAAHLAIVIMRVLPATSAFVTVASPYLEARLLSRDEVSRFLAASDSATRVATQLGVERFLGMPNALMTGQAIEAVRGLYHFLAVPEVELLRGLVEGTSAIVREVEAIGDPQLTAALHKHGLCATSLLTLEQLTSHERARRCGLREPHILALRLYTCADAFRHFNDPMRDRGRLESRQAHPLALTIAFLADGVRKLRLEYLTTRPGAQAGDEAPTVLYRGLRGVTVGDTFMEGRVGGTELAVMSTTSSWDVAVGFVLQRADGPPLPAAQSVVLRLVVTNAVQYGADVAWLSVNPGEHEVIFPPLCYLQPTGRFELVRAAEGSQLTVVEVAPYV